MKMPLLGPAASIRPTRSRSCARASTSSLSILTLLLAASLAVGCSDEDRDPPTTTLDSAVGAGSDGAVVDSGRSDAGSLADAAAQPDAAAPDSAAPVDSGAAQPDTGQGGMDASGADASADGGDPADGALDGAAGDGAAQDAATDAAQDATADAGNWPVPGCDQSYRLVARSQSGGRFQVGSGDHYQTFTFDAPWGSQQVQAIAFRLVLDNGQIVKRVNLENADGEILTQFAAGDDRFVVPEDFGIGLPTGARSLRLGVRYINTANSNRSDASGVDVCIVRGDNLRSTRAAVTTLFGSGHPAIPANTANVEVTSACDVNNVQPVELLSAGPYAHPYVVWTKFTVIKKNGDEIVMHHQAYEFDAQSVFPITRVRIEKGDRVETTCVFTNETDEELPAEDGSHEVACSNFALYAPANTNVLNCTPVP